MQQQEPDLSGDCALHQNSQEKGVLSVLFSHENSQGVANLDVYMWFRYVRETN